MPKFHNIGPVFVQLTKFPYEWGGKFVVRGWTQEIEEPFRTAKPVIVRLPKYKAAVFGRWSGMKSEEEALNTALEARDATEDDFTEKAGWTPAADSDREEGSNNLNTRLNYVDGAVHVHNGEAYLDMAEAAERSRS